MKKVLLLILCAVLAFSFVGCTPSEEAEELVSYINNDLAELEEYEADFLESYDSVSGDNYTDDATMYEEFSTNTLDYLTAWEEKATDVAENIKDSKIAEVHTIYTSRITKCRNVLVTMLDALETQDLEKVTKANDMMTEASELATEFRSELDELAEEYSVEIER